MPRPRDDTFDEGTAPRGIRFPCPVCGGRVRAAASASGKSTTCPRCGEPLRVPEFATAETAVTSPREPRAESGRPRKSRAKPPRVVRRETPSDARTAAPPPSPLDRLADYRQEEVDDPPAWTFFSDVFNVPWQPGAAIRWILLSIGLAATGLVFTVVLALSGGLPGAVGGPGGPVALVIAFFVLPLFWLGFYSFSYAAACGMAIVEDTAAGMRRVNHWPDPHWKEWSLHLFTLCYLLAVACVPAWALGRAVASVGGPHLYWPTALATLSLLFPFLLLSALECGSAWAPVSGVVARSLLPLGGAWLLYYALTALVTGTWFVAVWLGAVRLGMPYATSVLTAPLLAAVFFVDARLLGRLAWRIGERGVPIVDE